jgi:hypothetical protein
MWRRGRGVQGAVAGAIALSLLGCKGKPDATSSELGEAAAVAMLRGVAEAAKVLEPWPCAALEEAPAPPVALRMEGWRMDGLALVPVGAASASAVVGFVGDAGGGAAATVVQLRRAAELFAARKVAVIVALGGMGQAEEEIAAGLRALATGGNVVVAMPGDLESLAEHKRAVARLQQEELAVVDGSVVRWLKLGPATIATLPGARHRAQLVAGNEGCAFDEAAVEATLGRLAEAEGVKILASWAAPRSGAASASSGDLALRTALDRAKVDLAIAGEPTLRGGATDRAGRAGGGLQVARAGFSDGEPRLPGGGKPPAASALLVKIGRAEWQLERVELATAP